ncbi:UNVERIFIED_CONTAM: hypothetical protein K2H54_021550 [Gekko kuhli]
MGEDEGSDLPICASCSNSIYDGQYLQALNADWHADCFSAVASILSMLLIYACDVTGSRGWDGVGKPQGAHATLRKMLMLQ